jgi:hypothetical protein
MLTERLRGCAGLCSLKDCKAPQHAHRLVRAMIRDARQAGELYLGRQRGATRGWCAGGEQSEPRHVARFGPPAKHAGSALQSAIHLVTPAVTPAVTNALPGEAHARPGRILCTFMAMNEYGTRAG